MSITWMQLWKNCCTCKRVACASFCCGWERTFSAWKSCGVRAVYARLMRYVRGVCLCLVCTFHVLHIGRVGKDKRAQNVCDNSRAQACKRYDCPDEAHNCRVYVKLFCNAAAHAAQFFIVRFVQFLFCIHAVCSLHAVFSASLVLHVAALLRLQYYQQTSFSD